MTVTEIKQFLLSHGLWADVYKSGHSVHVDIEDNVFGDIILNALEDNGYEVYRENLPYVFTVDKNHLQL